jgi:urea transport system permease protein
MGRRAGLLLSFASHALTTEQAYAMAAADDSEQRVQDQSGRAGAGCADRRRSPVGLSGALPTMKCASQGKAYVVTAMRSPTR